MRNRPSRHSLEERMRRALGAGAANADAVVAAVLHRIGDRLPAQLEASAPVPSLRRSIGVAAAVLTILVGLTLRSQPSFSGSAVPESGAALSSRWIEEEQVVRRYSTPANILTALFVREVLE